MEDQTTFPTWLRPAIPSFRCMLANPYMTLIFSRWEKLGRGGTEDEKVKPLNPA
jgi:hypothetical protein